MAIRALDEFEVDATAEEKEEAYSQIGAASPIGDSAEYLHVSEPRDVAETGLGPSFLIDLLSKAIYYGADPTPLSLS